MSLQNDAGEETYTGAREMRTDDPSRSLRHVVIFDESEGQIGWYIGYDGPACVTLGREGDRCHRLDRLRPRFLTS